MELDALIEMSHKYGADADFVLAGGGNTSYKTADTLYIKEPHTACVHRSFRLCQNGQSKACRHLGYEILLGGKAKRSRGPVGDDGRA